MFGKDFGLSSKHALHRAEQTKWVKWRHLSRHDPKYICFSSFSCGSSTLAGAVCCRIWRQHQWSIHPGCNWYLLPRIDNLEDYQVCPCQLPSFLFSPYWCLWLKVVAYCRGYEGLFSHVHKFISDLINCGRRSVDHSVWKGMLKGKWDITSITSGTASFEIGWSLYVEHGEAGQHKTLIPKVLSHWLRKAAGQRAKCPS